MRVKVQVSGNPFYYGLAMLDWLPYSTSDVIEPTGSTLYDAIPATQRLKILIDPTTSSGGELVLPFVYPFNSLPLTSGTELASLGRLTLRELVGLQHAGGATATQPITITVFAWAEDVQLTLPTSVNPSGLVAQNEEIEESTTVKVSSAVAEAAGSLKMIPQISGLAMATEIGARGVGDMARLYGFSRPIVPMEPTNMRPQIVGPIAVTDCGDSSQKLTVTAAQQVTVDPSVVGVKTNDELVISDIAGRESLLNTVSWTNTQANGTLLYNYRVQPFACPLSGSTYYPTPAAFATMPFKYWRGTMRYRIRVCNSGFHRGKLRVTWDPNYTTATSAPELNVSLTRIIDIETERDIVMDIPWGSERAFLPRPNTIASSANYMSSTRYSTTSAYSNGVMSFHVQNALASANTAATSITLVVFVSCPDLCVAAPNDPGIAEVVNIYSATVQNDDLSNDSEGAPPEGGEAHELHDNQCPPDMSKVFFGEKITSFRQLLKRYSFHSLYRRSTLLTGIWELVATDFPAYKGYNGNPLHATSTGKKFNYVNLTLLHYLAPAFLAARGGHRTKYVASATGANAGTGCTMSLSRELNYNTLGVNETAFDTTSASTLARSLVVTTKSGMDGAIVTELSKMPVIEAELPYYKAARFDLARDIDLSSNNTTAASFGLGNLCHRLSVLVSASSSPIYISRYTAVADDFTLSFFIGCPPMQAMPNATLPAAAVV